MTEQEESVEATHIVVRGESPEGKKYYKKVKRRISKGQPPPEEKPSPMYPTNRPPVEHVPMGGAKDD